MWQQAATVLQKYVSVSGENMLAASRTLTYWPDQLSRKYCLHSALLRSAKFQEDSLFTSIYYTRTELQHLLEQLSLAC